MACRPQEVSNWIKSKKKDVVPSVSPAQFGSRFSDWWMMMQPGWRKDDVRSLVMLVLYRDTPPGETWQGLRKGGMAGRGCMSSLLVFESPVRSGLLPSRAWTETETGLCKLKTCKRPDRTAKDRSTVVGLGLFAVTRPVLTGYG